MNFIRRVPILVTLVGLAVIISLLQNFSSTRRAISLSEQSYARNDGDVTGAVAPRDNLSKLHYMWDEQLETRYSTTHQRMRGQFSLILNDNDETNSGNNDFQHNGILRTSSEKHGNWMTVRHAHPDFEKNLDGEIIRKAGTNYSKLVDDMRFVIDANHTIIFPNDTMEINGKNNHLCQILRTMTGRKDSLDEIPKYGIPPIVLKITADCDVFNNKIDGQGNAILALYGVRMTTALAKVDFEFQCKNNNFQGGSNNHNPSNYKKEKSRKMRWVFPWFASFQSSSDSGDPWPYLGDAPTQNQVCSSSKKDLDNSNDIMPLEKMAGKIREDVRKMSLQLIGSRTEGRKRLHPLIPLDVEPWIPNIIPDDVIIHFPCYSDVNDWDDATTSRRNRVGILQFREYTNRIHPDTKSIGIIRESFGESRRNSNEDVCYRASTLLANYIRSFFPKQVSISIYDNDTLPLQYARMAMAEQSFSSFSTFGMIPIIGTFGIGYFQPSVPKTNITTFEIVGNQNSIIRNIVSSKYESFENVKLMNGGVLSQDNISTMRFSEISTWLLKSSP